MDFTEKALVLRTGRFREADLWVRFLSPSRGVITAFAFGGCRSRRRFCGCLDALNHVLVKVSSDKRRTYLCLDEGTLLNGPVRLRSDWGRTGVAANCIKFVEAMGVGPEGAADAYDLTCGMLELLETADVVPEIFPVLFRGRLAFDQGYRIDPVRCARCGMRLKDVAGVRFLPREGVFECSAHGGASGGGFMMSAETLDAVRFVQENPPLMWTDIPLSPEGWKQWGRAVDAFIQYHVGLVWDKGRFRRI
ncbi:DNA repair protein RecO [Oleidesulfovibrio alaskensis G20]|jgi:DNA repair protein RecO (recombination protein O)|uniref:DNA repair protein RecO n=1 Tax=Oleidesulfovibrio alaskensis (strain ATCC BAA-1058 / DSM 17464 / G20) TaxID=207559 RepID=RECO_OLEA2|nr:DNA repair protein RecO [Oleidesulfovibrio alaskensis]Q30ZR4.1 RecName: Full=DNA repair protein RecO; AltName: Full=Recombination protein O [Oleidesulfovibrio alaskensis G20]ABB38832.1 DNA repair protein RecO [Oleidesulfovibrio alaskensis G20]MBG0773132.1 DNA repair protein RecO C-terminal domain-containing protein [Oleidesulfovibrio alaskensis]MBL3582707.1 DNA repair protein RecO C-terminal domain-containing protein [Oleidesulfovibrio alaskensis]